MMQQPWNTEAVQIAREGLRRIASDYALAIAANPSGPLANRRRDQLIAAEERLCEAVMGVIRTAPTQISAVCVRCGAAPTLTIEAVNDV